jgi:hypothetical protein
MSESIPEYIQREPLVELLQEFWQDKRKDIYDTADEIALLFGLENKESSDDR